MADRRRLYILERELTVNGQHLRVHVSTRCHGERQALKHLERFEADPLGYSPLGVEAEKPVYLTEELTAEFEVWQLGKGVTRKHANAVQNRLADWIEDLARVDLRTATLRDHVLPALNRHKSQRAHRISTLKVFYAWLREVRHTLTNSEDPTLDLPVPQSVPEKRRRRKAVPFPTVQAVLGQLTPDYRDVLLLMTRTGWHFTELERFVRSPDSEIIPMKRGKTIAVLRTLHKSREETRTPIEDRIALATAVRLRARGTVPKRPNDEIRKACKTLDVPPFGLGVMRHSVATWAMEAGADAAQLSAFLGHKDPRTVRRFYADVAVPTSNVPLPKLRLVR